MLVHASLAARHPGLMERLATACTSASTEVCAHPVDLPDSVHWRGGADMVGRVVLVWSSDEVMRMAMATTLVASLARARAAADCWAPGCGLTLVVAGRGAGGLDECVGMAQLEAGVSVRRVLDAKELTDLLCSYADALSRAARAPAQDAAFLQGLTAHDVLHNKGVPKSLRQAWLGALRQLLPESAARAVQAQYPSFRRLYEHLLQAERAGGRPEGDLAEVRVGQKRLGPARSRRLARVLMARREAAGEQLV